MYVVVWLPVLLCRISVTTLLLASYWMTVLVVPVAGVNTWKG